ncbi:MAG: Fe-S cluster assembly protein SufD [Bacteroidetes bacterium CG2_30_32_10]|nr:MAG: Fe-S cluster assembly protein SufD [Bacteroidetes bacterium CG2_30_32_10]
MEQITIDISLKDKMLALFEKNKQLLFKNNSKSMIDIKNNAIAKFNEIGFPHTKLEEWRLTNIEPYLKAEYQHHLQTKPIDVDIESIFQCEVPDLDTFVVVLFNGRYIYKHTPLTKLDNGTIIGSFEKALEEYPEIIEKHFNKYAKNDKNGFVALNTAFAQDGIFIYVPQNIIVEQAIQIINIINTTEEVFVQPRNLFIVEKNSSITLVSCDHSLTQTNSFSNAVTEILIDENAQLNHIRVQNKGKNSTLLNTTFVEQKNYAMLTSNVLTLNSGFIRNDLDISLNGEGCEANLYGIYLADKTQFVDNHTFVDHLLPNSNSKELYKGILDDKAKAVFSGKVMVRRDAQKTNAFQANKNILLTDEATINTKPHLEIYADDVKCSHGATVGQLDNEAMFYLRSRGLGEDCARMLLMYAFADEVINKIPIEALRVRLGNMVSKRLRGELSVCDQCVMHCNSKSPTQFNIDLSKL